MKSSVLHSPSSTVARRRSAALGTAAVGALCLVAVAMPPSLAADEPVAILDASTVSIVIDPPMPSFGTKVKAQVKVESEGAEPTGTIEILDGETVIATDTLWTRFSSGKASITLPRDLAVGRRHLVAVYSGNDDVSPSTGRGKVNVLRSSPKVAMTTKSWQVKKGTRPKVTVLVRGPKGGPHPSGLVRVRHGSSYTKARLVDGAVTMRLGKISEKTRTKVIYLPQKNNGYTRTWTYYTFTIKR